MNLRKSIIDCIELLSLPSKQLEYEKNVPIANVPAELICGFCDDLYHPKSERLIAEFTEEELKGLAHLYGMLCESTTETTSSVKELLKTEKWRSVVWIAKDLADHYKRNPVYQGSTDNADKPRV